MVKLFFGFLLIVATSAHAIEFNDGVRAHDALEKQVMAMFEKKQFAKLDSMAEQFRKNKSRFADGTWKLSIFYSALDLSSRVPEPYFISHIERLKEWRRDRPSSVTAQCALAQAWMDYAWEARGTGYSSEVKEDSWQLVNERLNNAWMIVNERLAPGVRDCPSRLNLRLHLAKAMGVERKVFETLFLEAQRQEPGYYSNYVVKASFLLPKWHGEKGEWQQFIAKVSKQNPRGEGATIYARTAWSMYSANEWKDFKGSEISWDKMKTGFTEIEKNYPNSPWILNNFARFSCRAGDIQTMTALFKRIDTHHYYYPEAWEKDDVKACRRYVKLGKSEYQINQEKMEENNRRLQASLFNNLLELAQKGNRKVIGDLSEKYFKGIGTPRDPVAAHAWLLQDQTAYREQLAASAKSLTPNQLQLARQRAEQLRRKIALQTKG